LTGGGAGEATFVGSSAGGDTFKDFAALFNGNDRETVAHTWNVGGDRTIAQGNEYLRALTNFPDFFEIIFGADRSFNEDYIHVIREILAIDQRTMDQLDESSQFKQTLIHIEK